MTYDALDCQGFAGGFTLGMVQAGFHLVGKREMQGGFGGANCLANRHLLGWDWDYEACDPSEWTAKQVPVVFGNPPCSGFSLMSHRDFRGVDSPINSCMHSLIELAARCDPEIVCFESVQQAFSQGRELMQVLRAKLEQLTGQSYTLYHVLHNAASVGGAAIRKRYFFTASRMPFGIEQPKVDRVPVLDEVIGDLRDLHLTWERQPYRHEPSWWVKRRGLRDGTGTVDGHMNRSHTLLQKRITELIDGAGWEQGEYMSLVLRRYYERHGGFPPLMKHLEEKIVAKDFQMGYTQVTRWRGHRVARVITGGGVDLTIHPQENRSLTHREVARIQGFPDAWRIAPLRGESGLNLTWGKGIPVQCGEWIGGWIKTALDGHPGPDDGEEIGDRERKIDCTNAYRAVCAER